MKKKLERRQFSLLFIHLKDSNEVFNIYLPIVKWKINSSHLIFYFFVSSYLNKLNMYIQNNKFLMFSN